MRIRYGRWTGTQDPLGQGVTADEVLAEVGDELLEGADPAEALRQLQRRGLSQRGRGLDELRRRVEQARRREAQRMGLAGPMREAEEALGEIVDRESTAVAFSAEEERAAVQRAHLDALPDDVAGRISHLEEHDWQDAQAEQDFRDLVDGLRQDVAEATFGQLASALGQMGPEDVARMRDLLADLNAMIAKRERGEDIDEDFAAFKERYGDVLPGDPETLDELLADLAQRMAAMRSLMAGMSDEQRQQLAEMSEELLGDEDLAFQANELQRALQSQFPGLDWDVGPPGTMPVGPETGSLARHVDWVEHLKELEDLASQLGQRYPGADLEDIDEELLRRVVGEEAVADVQALREIERVLEESGAAERHRGSLELTPRGVRLLGERSLERIFSRTVEGEVGSHRAPSAGGDGEPTGTTRQLRFGDPFRLDVTETVKNAVLRRAGEGVAPHEGVRLHPDDFAFAEAERRVRAVTVLLLDMSFSMPLRGNWLPAKRVAVALQSLIEGRYPEDRFFVVGFSDYARRLEARDLLVSGWERVYGTNMQHAFMIARRLLGRHAGSECQVIMITDGEPTAHLEGGQAFFAWPPERETLRRTLEEGTRLARTGATMNVFLLDHDLGAAQFVEHLVTTIGGRIFYPDLEDLGRMVVRDFLRHRHA
ncbi:hypothetical protein ER308_18630 [Egibacter rhizosphaerae]|uniref:VWFA domain-containing protein n=1 Tax=Egibacter rhizosphaerae TaxID=1670831 RepID=A0A411YJH7_9ACTN|nr:hypothetical protein [Egibacter rhizosphaerae]QBI21383.1 hypothetical protein ER308_18630 [Egibacter rhizosphaerae]